MRHFHEQLPQLFQKVVLMGSTAESMIRTAVRTLIERKESLSDEVFAREQEVNRIQVEVDDQAVKLTALQQPVASDLRKIVGSIHIGADIERMGALAVHVASISRLRHPDCALPDDVRTRGHHDERHDPRDIDLQRPTPPTAR